MTRVLGFVKVRNEILREQNLYRLLAQMEQLCDGGVICDDASTDGTREAIEAWSRTLWEHWHVLNVPPAEQNWRNELHVKEQMLRQIHAMAALHSAGWILWQDGDELFDAEGMQNFRPWLEAHGEEADVWAFHYTQLWRSASYARTDSHFDEGRFWKLWRYRPDLSFEIKGHLHHAQFPVQYLDQAVAAAVRGGNYGRAKLAPIDVLHAGNYGKNLVLKAVAYRGSGQLENASLERHLYFGRGRSIPTYRPVSPSVLPPEAAGFAQSKDPPMPFSQQEIEVIERMGNLRKTPGLMTVIVPTCNRGYILDKTLRSVLAQLDQNWVCVVLDDGSTDNTPEVMRHWQDADPRFFYCRYEENRGGVAMNEIGCALACEFGEFWVRLGSDDYFEPHKLSLDRLAFEHAPWAGACYGPYFDKHETFVGRDLRNPPSDARGALLSRGFAASWANIAVRTSVLEAIRERHGNFCEPDLRNMEDWLLNTRIAFQAELVWRGLLESNEVVIGARKIEELGVGPKQVRADAVWRIGADGASQKAATCQKDSELTAAHISADIAKFKPTERKLDYQVVRIPWSL